ncbi:RodZ domain-containing protein [Pseudoalteromonas denitrificans]|uniref:Cytoskeleton protein RodZ n=1 Tax=Pseudoalteromonas denitrificans DSM 6059 TaxID=1123010 RepID=A0A1I1L4G5_9GAMM|nr:RodZ domain-containing protein [Pseudoalteromonas denitrificans]SFC67881.1 cytoskeleton protein RodZ [Pseudoalteromonas denitrificans DSM 6059]
MTDIKLEQDQIQAQSRLNLGRLLSEGREAADISIDSFATELNLNASQLLELENGQFNNLGPEIFVKGYIKSYCKLLGLNESEVLKCYQNIGHNPEQKQMQSFSHRIEKETHDSRLMLVTYIVLVIVFGSSAVWWWQNQTSENDIQVQEINENLQNNTALKNVKEESKPGFVESDETLSDSEIEESLPSESVKVLLAPKAADITKAENKPDIINEQVEIKEVATEAITNKIIMRFSGDSWVEIFDATGERVAFGVKKSGYVMTVNGVAPFAVVLGKQQLVAIEFDGEKVDTSGLPTNRLAKFKLPLSL